MGLFLNLLVCCWCCSLQRILNHHTLSGHYRPAIETPFKWRFDGGPIVARNCMQADYFKMYCNLTDYEVLDQS